ncbi:MAG: hypothetical protein DMD75_29880 [Candidatus Rokuibacteriota bacterium]|nr:MAG: hypothetical protein DMD75_29880 [Candidatus Rokubacteria bacterium]
MGGDVISIVSALIEAGNVDTMYRDVYLERARTLLSPVVSIEAFHRMEQQQSALASLPLAVARALEKADWPQVKELSLRTDALKQEMSRDGKLFESAHAVYAVTDVKLDPFCHSLQRFTRVAAKDLPALRTRVIEQLTTLEQSDDPWKDFYSGRRAVFQTRAPITSEPVSDGAARGPSIEDTRAAAAQALKAGDMKRLGQLADLLASAAPRASQSAPGATATAISTSEPGTKDLVASWSSDTLTRAQQIGLAPRHLDARPELASLRQYAWNPLSDDSHHVAVREVTLPPGSPDGLRDRLEVLMIHPLANSGGARHLPSLVAEDVLVEDFPDPAEGEQPPASPLLATLELPGRRGLTRVAIEQALLVHGARVLEKELDLDPRVFRLVCIPSDVHFRLGEAEGWGRKPFWTHFDGHLIRTVEGRIRLQALAGGDVRYGGLYDLLGVGRDDDSDRLVARFAVVHRERMVAW